MSKDRPWLTGKPKLDPAIKRSRVMNFNVTESQRADIKTLAEMCNLKPAQLVHKLVLNQLEKNASAIQAYRKTQQNMKNEGVY